MKFTVARDVLAEAVSWTAKSLPSNSVSPILAGVRITAKEDALKLSSFDYEVSSTIDLPAEVDGEGDVLVQGRMLSDIAKSLPNLPVVVEQEDQKVTITCGSSKFSLSTMAVDEYPLLPAHPQMKGTVDAQLMGHAISQVTVAASQDDALPLLAGVRIECAGSQMTLIATDRYRLAMRELTWEPTDPTFEEQALVKNKILDDIGRSMLSSSKIEIGLSTDSKAGASSLIGFSAGGRRTTSTLMDGDYPAVRRLFPESTTIQAVCEKTELLAAVKRVALVAEKKTAVQLSFSRGQVKLEAGAGDSARASEIVPATLYGDDIITAFNPRYLEDGLRVIDTDFVRFSFTHPTKPSVLTGQEKIDGEEALYFRYLLMPIRFGI